MGGSTTTSPTAAMAAAVLSPITIDTRREALMVLERDDDITSATPTNAKAKHSISGLLMLPLTPYPNNLLPSTAEDPDTPSSTIVEFGDLGKNDVQVPSAAELAEKVYRAFTNSHSEEDKPDEPEQPEKPVERRKAAETKKSPAVVKPAENTKVIAESRSRSQQRELVHPPTPIVGPRARSQSATRKPTGNTRESVKESRINGHDKTSIIMDRELANNKVNRFLNQMSQQDPANAQRELLLENRSLYERINSLQRIEREMLAENQDLMRQYSALRQHHDQRRRQWRDDYRLREKAFATRIHQLKEQIAEQETQMLEMARTHSHKPAPLLSDSEIVSWFTAKDVSWHSWAQDNAFRDSRRLSSKLHPLQLAELCRGIEGFVKLTEDGELPEEILAGGAEMVPTLLHGMLVNFICNEALGSPFWVFSAMSAGTLESPSIPEPTSNSPVGFRMDLALFNNITPRRKFPHTPGAPLFPPPLVTNMIPPLGVNAATVGLPLRSEMEGLHHMLANAQREDSDMTVHHWRAQTMRLFAESGIAIRDPQDPLVRRNEAGRMLVETRHNYARKLKERFLGGAARYLLKDQDASGIEKLERRLTQEIDDALRFSCQIWSRPTPLRFQGWHELGSREFRSTSDIMELCHAQAPPQSEQALLNPETPPPGYYDGRSVLMVVQPAIEALGLESNCDLDDEEISPDERPKQWLKARVVVSVVEPASGSETNIPAPDYEKVAGSSSSQTPSYSSALHPTKGFALRIVPGPTVSPKTHGKSSNSPKSPEDEKPTRAMEVLATTAFNPSPFPGDLPKISLTSATPGSATNSQGHKVMFNM